MSDITPPMTSSGSPTLLIVGIGLLLSLAIPVLIERMDHTIRDAKAATAAFSAPVLSLIPAVPRSRRDEVAAPGTAREAAFRALAATSVATDRLPRSIVVTSPLGDIQDTVAANFAAALASLGVHVALVGTSPRQAWFSRDGVVTANSGNGRALRIHRIRGAGEVRLEHVAEELTADRSAPRRGAHDRDRLRLEERAQRRDDGRVVALLDALFEALGRRDRELDLDDAAGEFPLELEACALEDAEHRRVLGKDLGHEALEIGRAHV